MGFSWIPGALGKPRDKTAITGWGIRSRDKTALILNRLQGDEGSSHREPLWWTGSHDPSKHAPCTRKCDVFPRVLANQFHLRALVGMIVEGHRFHTESSGDCFPHSPQRIGTRHHHCRGARKPEVHLAGIIWPASCLACTPFSFQAQ